jgi:hypothetical protein
MTPTQQKELQDHRATLPSDLREAFDQMIETRGEEAVYEILGLLKSQAEYIASL